VVICGSTCSGKRSRVNHRVAELNRPIALWLSARDQDFKLRRRLPSGHENQASTNAQTISTRIWPGGARQISVPGRLMRARLLVRFVTTFSSESEYHLRTIEFTTRLGSEPTWQANCEDADGVADETLSGGPVFIKRIESNGFASRESAESESRCQRD
jgi:hypothetical protein